MPQRKSTLRVSCEPVQGEDSYVVLRRITLGEAKKFRTLDGTPDFDRMSFLAPHILDWNWVDDDGEPLPLPSTDSTVLDVLTDAEVAFLVNALRGPQEGELKN